MELKVGCEKMRQCSESEIYGKSKNEETLQGERGPAVFYGSV